MPAQVIRKLSSSSRARGIAALGVTHLFKVVVWLMGQFELREVGQLGTALHGNQDIVMPVTVRSGTLSVSVPVC